MHDPEKPSRSIPLPHPEDVAARKALAAMPPASLERVLQQAAASRDERSPVAIQINNQQSSLNNRQSTLFAPALQSCVLCLQVLRLSFIGLGQIESSETQAAQNMKLLYKACPA